MSAFAKMLGSAPLPRIRPIAAEALRPIFPIEGYTVIPKAVLMIQRARVCRSIARQVIEARRANRMGLLEMVNRIGLDWRVVHNIEATGMLLLPKRELKGLYDMVDLATAMGREVALRFEDIQAQAAKARTERKLGLKPYGYDWDEDGRHALYAGGARRAA